MTMPGEGDRPRLKRIKIEGFRSIASADITFSDLDVFIGPNGAGKSNMIAFLRMVGVMLSSDLGLAFYVGRAGGSASLLHDGPKVTRDIAASVTIEVPDGVAEYAFRLQPAAADTLVFAEERVRFSGRDAVEGPAWSAFGSGHRSPAILNGVGEPHRPARQAILTLFRDLPVFHFQDTSFSAPPRLKSALDNGHRLRGDAGNLAAVLRRLRDAEPAYYARIVKTLRLMAPFFDDFDLRDEYGFVLLRWREKGSNQEFGPNDISDGFLRAMALVVLLQQPVATLPPLIAVDEPEIGLHPASLEILIGLLKAAAQARQCIVATQSPVILRALDPENVIVVDRPERSSLFRRLESPKLDRWLDDHDLDDLWDMNLLGGRPGSLAAE